MKSTDQQKSLLPSVLSYLHYVFFRIMTFAVNGLSAITASRLAESVGTILFLRKRRREFCLQNLRRAFPGKSEAALKIIGRGSMQGMVKVIFEFIRLPFTSKRAGDLIEVKGEEHVWKALEGGKGGILVVSHFGNWELAGIAAAARGIPIYAVGKPHKNSFIDRYIKRLRGLTGLKTINREGAVQSCIRLLKQNKIIAVLIDEHTKKGGVWVNFFSHQTSTTALPATLALKYGAPIIPAFFYRERNRRSVLAFGEAFDLHRTGDHHVDILTNTQEYINYLQKEIVKRPADWTLWMHNRWRWPQSDRQVA